jgi:hypothetical protein
VVGRYVAHHPPKAPRRWIPASEPVPSGGHVEVPIMLSAAVLAYLASSLVIGRRIPASLAIRAALAGRKAPNR